MSASEDLSNEEKAQMVQQFGLFLGTNRLTITCDGALHDEGLEAGSPSLPLDPSALAATSEQAEVGEVNLPVLYARTKALGVPLMAVGLFQGDGENPDEFNKNLIYNVEVGDMEACLDSSCLRVIAEKFISTCLAALERNVKAVLVKPSIAAWSHETSGELAAYNFVTAVMWLMKRNFRLQYRHEESRREKEARKQPLDTRQIITAKMFGKLPSSKEVPCSPGYDLDPFSPLTPRQVWIEVSVHEEDCASSAELLTPEQVHDQAWHWWSDLPKYVQKNPKLALCLKVGSNFPDDFKRTQRWFGERLRAILIPDDVWRKNKAGFPVLPAALKSFIVRSFHLPHVTYLLSDNGTRHREQFLFLLHLYKTYLRGLKDPFRQKVMRHLADAPIRPLQPLRDHLTPEIYGVFEADPIKYRLYHDAIRLALIDLKDAGRGLARADPIVATVAGAGRGPLVTQFIEAAVGLGMFFRVYAMDKNPMAISAMKAKLDGQTGEWKQHAAFITIIHRDMRRCDNVKDPADLLISELLGSFGCNELSPECLDGAQKFLKPNGVSIPESYSSYLQPVMATGLHQDLRTYAPRAKKFLNEMVLVDLRSFVEIAPYQEAFTFRHPNFQPHSNERDVELTFQADNDYCLTGFAGYFVLNLFKGVSLNILPDQFTVGLTSWFPAFFALARPVDVKKDGQIILHMGRRVSEEDRRVWYDWCLMKPPGLPLQNAQPDYWLSM